VKYEYDSNYPTVEALRVRARRRVPRFAFEYLDGGCNEDVNVHRNTADLREVQLEPYYLRDHSGIDLKTELFGHVYDAPFGIAPMGLQGLIWPQAAEILAKASAEYNVTFILSTAGTSSIETIAEITNGRAWFQLYHPTENSLRDKLIIRCDEVGCPVLVVVCDVPTVGFRPRDIRNGLSMPPKMTVRNMLQIAANCGETWLGGADPASRASQLRSSEAVHAGKPESGKPWAFHETLVCRQSQRGQNWTDSRPVERQACIERRRQRRGH
jgi:L-lactate dehydrogenase (cytochrome)